MTLRLHDVLLNGLLFCLLAGSAADAQRARQPPLNCGLYDRMERQCKCNGTDDYFIKYGRRYCERFLKSTGWTPAGSKWRDHTLLCLQQSLARDLRNGRTSGPCDCRNMRQIASATHVRCYTQASPSVCQLPLSDLLKIYQGVDAVDLLSPYGSSQVLSIVGACLLAGH